MRVRNVMRGGLNGYSAGKSIVILKAPCARACQCLLAGQEQERERYLVVGRSLGDEERVPHQQVALFDRDIAKRTDPRLLDLLQLLSSQSRARASSQPRRVQAQSRPTFCKRREAAILLSTPDSTARRQLTRL